MTRRVPATTAALAVIAAFCAPIDAARAAPPEPPAGDWNFRASLDGEPIGEHRFHIGGTAAARTVRSEATFAVKVIGITVYRYHHLATEAWNGACLQTLNAATDDDGKQTQVHAQTGTDRLAVKTGAGSATLGGCVMSFAYWNPAIQTQTGLLNAQTGRLETVQLSRAGEGSLEVHGKPVAATRWRIDGAEHPIDVWYSAAGRWIGLDSTVAGGRKLSYRLE